MKNRRPDEWDGDPSILARLGNDPLSTEIAELKGVYFLLHDFHEVSNQVRMALSANFPLDHFDGFFVSFLKLRRIEILILETADGAELPIIRHRFTAHQAWLAVQKRHDWFPPQSLDIVL
jgi:hypothetical protein